MFNCLEIIKGSFGFYAADARKKSDAADHPFASGDCGRLPVGGVRRSF